MIVFEHPRQGGADACLAEPNHIADQHAVALVQVIGGDLDGIFLELHQLAIEHLRNAELADTLARFARQVIRHLQIDVIGRHGLFTRPALLDDSGQIVGNVDAPGVVPARIEPC